MYGFTLNSERPLSEVAQYDAYRTHMYGLIRTARLLRAPRRSLFLYCSTRMLCLLITTSKTTEHAEHEPHKYRHIAINTAATAAAAVATAEAAVATAEAAADATRVARLSTTRATAAAALAHHLAPRGE